MTHIPSAVIDTNVWISGLIFGGNPEKVIQLFSEGALSAVTSEELLSELRRKIAGKFLLFLPNLSLLEDSIREQAIIVPLGLHPVSASRDPKDNMVIETAIAGLARLIITGDQDLLVLGHYDNIQIVSPAEYLRAP